MAERSVACHDLNAKFQQPSKRCNRTAKKLVVQSRVTEEGFGGLTHGSDPVWGRGCFVVARSVYRTFTFRKLVLSTYTSKTKILRLECRRVIPTDRRVHRRLASSRQGGLKNRPWWASWSVEPSMTSEAA
jgi:hypothetical protein